ncbi:MAG: hypothetical protein A4E57_03961 [Syntrophorhabdaceae bacterium PtaU1.Bin034]|jgi:uncharacterized protein (DUF169 family)|nr:MAG: hypothetical protein A4E57_03961 [Syntrophorhabdaceae bacterium PtaU1.Bin034]
MSLDDTLVQIRRSGEEMIRILGLDSSPVGVRFLREGTGYPEGSRILKQHRYCQSLMRARHGKSVVLDAGGIACPAAAAAFGFKPLPDGLRSGKGLMGFGIVQDSAVGKKMFKRMPRLTPMGINALHLYPLEKALYVSDVVVVEDRVERLMWVALACLHAKGGERITSSTAILQATCVDSTIVPYLDQRLNLSYGCYGCRDATDIGADEAVLGFPGVMHEKIVQHLTFLARKAIPVSRKKGALASLRGRLYDSRGQVAGGEE